MLISTTAVLAIIFAPLAAIMFANAYLVPNVRSMRYLIAVGAFGLTVLCGYWVLRTFNIVETGEPIPTLVVVFAFILFVFGLYSVFGVPLLVEVNKRKSASQRNL